MKLRIGLIDASPVWEQVCRQEGVPFETVLLSSAPLHELYSIIVINRSLSEVESVLMDQYLRAGGAVFGFAPFMTMLGGMPMHEERLEYLVGDDDGPFAGVGLLDVGGIGFIPREAGQMRTQTNTRAIFAGPFGGGCAVIVPFDVADVLTDMRVALKNFYSPWERLPSERVSLAGKGEVRHLLHMSFKYLHHARGVPYAHLWYFPDAKANLFAFRIDTDGASMQDVDELYSVARSHDIKMSWYLDVKSHEHWLTHFRAMTDQEIGLHCYEHQTFPTFDPNMKNISRAKRAMEAAGLHPSGFTAPYGVWNTALAKAVADNGFEYSSEFSFAYDTLPVSGKSFDTLQVPIHPICIGSLREAGYTAGRMKEYYSMVCEEKLRRNEPLFFYHHPTHHHWDVVEFLFKEMRRREIPNATFLEYARWWKAREQYTLEMSVDKESIATTRSRNAGPGMFLRIIHVNSGEVIVPISDRIDLNTLTWDFSHKKTPPPADLRRIREFDTRAALGGLYRRFMRRMV